MTEREEVYLGDGLYASFDGYQIRLRAPRAGGDDFAYLDKETLASFEEFVKRVKASQGVDP